MENLLQIKGLRKEYGATIALQEINMEIEKGSVHAIIGENGAGKSTLIKILSGLITPNRGTIHFCNELFRPKNLSESRKLGVATAFQELSLLPNLTVAQNMVLPKLKKNKALLTSEKKNIETTTKILQQ